MIYPRAIKKTIKNTAVSYITQKCLEKIIVIFA